MNDLNDIMVFARVARERSFTRAAKSLGMPKSTVSERIARLKAQLNVRLIERTTRTLRLTVSGEAYFARVARIVQELEEAEAAVSAAHKLPRGTLRVASPMLFAQVFLADVVSEYLTKFPEVHVELIAADRSFDVLEEKLDVAVHVLGALDAQLVARKLAIGDRYLVASADYVARHGTPATPPDLLDHACVVVGAACSITWTFEADGQTRAVSLVGRYAVTSIELAHRATVAGHGIALLPAFMCLGELATGRLVRVLEPWRAGGEIAIHLVYPSHRHLPARVRSFVDLVLERLPAFPLRAGLTPLY